MVIISTTAFCIAGLNPGIIIQSMILSEVSAKLAMVVGAWVGKSAHEGMNTHFVDAMHGRRRKLRLTAALLISFGTAIPLLWIVGLITVLAGLVTALIMVGVSNRHFRGVTGDVMGAMNELARMASLITILAVVGWA